MKKILLIGGLTPMLFVGCLSKQVKILQPKENIEYKIEKKVNIQKKIDPQKEKQLQEKVEVLAVKQRHLEEQMFLEEKKLELKKRLDKEALINADQELKAEEVRDYTIDENTPLILKNQSEEKAYE